MNVAIVDIDSLLASEVKDRRARGVGAIKFDNHLLAQLASLVGTFLILCSVIISRKKFKHLTKKGDYWKMAYVKIFK